MPKTGARKTNLSIYIISGKPAAMLRRFLVILSGMRSAKELSLDNKLIKKIGEFKLSGKAEAVLKLLLSDKELQTVQEYANTVSIVRLGFNDHGPVHMRIVVMNAMLMLNLLRRAKIKTSLEQDGCGDFEDSLTAVICAAMMHDVGMVISRQDHDLHSVTVAYPILDRILAKVFGTDMGKRVMIRSMALEGIVGHMGTRTVHSLEAGVVQIADGCDMTKGRARIPIAMHQTKGGYIHQYSANSIEKVNLCKGKEKPILIDVLMSDDVGLFQVEEVLLRKISNSTAKPYIELQARVGDRPVKQYL